MEEVLTRRKSLSEGSLYMEEVPRWRKASHDALSTWRKSSHDVVLTWKNSLDGGRGGGCNDH